MNEKELFMMMGFLKSSKRRLTTLRAISDSIKTPTEISHEINLRTIQVSDALIELKKKNLVVCLNDECHKGRLYTATDFGKEILREYDNLFNFTPMNGE